jgi:hypothetical protein
MFIEMEISGRVVFLCLRHSLREVYCKKETRGDGWELEERKIW